MQASLCPGQGVGSASPGFHPETGKALPAPQEEQPCAAEPKGPSVLQASQGQVCDEEQVIHWAVPSPAVR